MHKQPQASAQNAPNFSGNIIAWQKLHGRHDLPWQNTTDPYAIWVSEIMLQQTQVSAVIAYFLRFMARFPDIASLASATQEEVLQYWSGLGYYSRARNLHNAAQNIIDNFGGVFPQKFDDILSLPGIGRSTAAAISSFAFKISQPILDGNVKRVFARHFLVEGWTGSPKIEVHLWQLVEQYMPDIDIVAYTQGLMDLGATLCTRRKPKCGICPLNDSCGAFKQNRVSELPTPKTLAKSPERSTTMLILLRGNEVMLEKRPPSGIWGGLWSFPETDDNDDYETYVLSRFGMIAETKATLPRLSHAFSHFKLKIQPQPMDVLKLSSNVAEPGHIWLSIDDAIGAAIPTPVRKILRSIYKVGV